MRSLMLSLENSDVKDNRDSPRVLLCQLLATINAEFRIVSSRLVRDVIKPAQIQRSLHPSMSTMSAPATRIALATRSSVVMPFGGRRGGVRIVAVELPEVTTLDHDRRTYRRDNTTANGYHNVVSQPVYQDVESTLLSEY
jgi:hypothetical protein